MKVRYSYLRQQFSNCPELWSDLKKFVKTGDFTLGKPLIKFEKNFAKYPSEKKNNNDAIDAPMPNKYLLIIKY